MATQNRFWRRLLNRFLHSHRPPARRRDSTGTATLSIEALEARRLLSIAAPFIHPNDGRLVINGSTLADQVNVSESSPGVIHVRIDSDGATLESDFSKSQISTILFRGNEGNDHFENQSDLQAEAHGGSGDDILVGGSSTDTIYGDEGNDLIVGGAGDDYLVGSAGNDEIRGDQGGDVLLGGDGADRLDGGEGVDTLDGGSGDDQLNGGSGNDTLRGRSGNDVLRGNEGNDLGYGGDDDDRIHGGEGDDELRAGAGNDTLWGDAGADLLVGDGGNDELLGADGNDELHGGDGDDLLYGQLGDDRLYGEAGNDILRGQLGNDLGYGGDGDDQLHGGDGDDELRAGAGNDTLWGDAGADLLFGDRGNDELLGADGNDELHGGDGDDLLYGQLGDDRLYGEADNDILRGQLGNDFGYGGDGDDQLHGGDGDDELRAGAGNDTLLGEAGADLLVGDGGNDQLLGADGNDELHGGDGDDKLFGQRGDDRLYGQAGNDILRGQLGNDFGYGGDGEDRIHGGDGDDEFRAGAGDDTLWGDAGADLLVGDGGNDLLLGGGGADRLRGGDGVDAAYGGLGDDELHGGADGDTLKGDSGNDTLRGDQGDDLLHGDAGNDTLFGGADDDQIHGDAGNDLIYGGDGNDRILAGSGDDTLFGDAGNDVIYGGQGSDEVRGGSGDDQLFGENGADTLAGAEGRDLVSGGSGDDSLSGGAGHDLLLGGDQRDSLIGDGGNDLLIGGDDVDSINGRAGDDLLIGGTTSHSLAILDVALTVWSEDPSYDSRILVLEQETFQARLVSEDTVFDDYVPDTVIGGDGQDWFFLPGTMSIYDPTDTFVNEAGHQHDENAPHSHLPVPVVGNIPVVEGFALIDSLDEIRDLRDNESLHTRIPHARDSSRHREHLTLFELVKYADVTHAAISSGDWSNSATWADGVVPGDGARVLIPIGVSVAVDQVLPARLATVRVDGELSFATNVHTQLNVDTVVVGSKGSLTIGTAVAPIASNVTAHLRFTDSGPIDRTTDPFGIGRGLITHGSVEMYGAEVTSHVELLGPVTSGTSLLVLSNVPVGWKVGDQIVVAGTSTAADQDEVRQILGIAGNGVAIAPLAFDHVPPSSELKIHVANLTRNIVIDSQASEISRRGHVMFMHNRDVQVHYAGFYRLGRTDKTTPLNDSVVDDNWQLVQGTGTNDRARYPVHFHRSGAVATGNPSLVHGSVVFDAPGWGYVNHSSFVHFAENVSYSVTGAGFVTEVGDEVGLFQSNIAINTSGSGEEIDSRRSIDDFGHTGDGFWFQGAGIEVVDNVSVGADQAAFTLYTSALRVNGQRATYLAANLPDPSIANGAETIAIGHVPIGKFQGNTGYASNTGLIVRLHLKDVLHQQASVIENSTFWNNVTGVYLPYSQQLVLRNLKLVRTPDSLTSIGVGKNSDTTDVIYDNLTISGYYTGIDVARRGYSVVNGGTFTTQRAIVVSTASRDNRQVVVQGPITFNPTPFDFKWMHEVDLRFDSFYAGGIERIFRSHTVTLNYGSYVNQKVYFFQQHPDHILYPAPQFMIPDGLIGLTAEEIQDQYGQTIGGEFAPRNSVTTERINGLLHPN